jgi:hypothetical protein
MKPALEMLIALRQALQMTDETILSQTSPRWRWLVWMFAALGFTAAIAVIWLVLALNSAFDRRPPAEVAAKAKDEVWVIGNVAQLHGTDYVTIEIDDRNGSSGSSIKSGMDRQRNLLFLNQKSGEVHRLLPDNNTRITSLRFAPAAATDGDKYDSSSMVSKDHPPAYYAVNLVRADRKGIDLLVGELAGFRQAVVMQGLNGIDRMWMIDDHQMGLIVREKQQLFFRVVDIPAQKVVRSQKIDIG